METESRPFKVPARLPLIPYTWQRELNTKWEGEKAAIYRLIDGEGNATPIMYQYDKRSPPVFKTGFSIMCTGLIFDTWLELHDYWPTYLENVVQEADKTLKQACKTEKDEDDIQGS